MLKTKADLLRYLKEHPRVEVKIGEDGPLREANFKCESRYGVTPHLVFVTDNGLRIICNGKLTNLTIREDGFEGFGPGRLAHVFRFIEGNRGPKTKKPHRARQVPDKAPAPDPRSPWGRSGSSPAKA